MPNNSSNKPKTNRGVELKSIRDLLFSSSVELSGDRDICDMKVTRKLTWEIYEITYNFEPKVWPKIFYTFMFRRILFGCCIVYKA